LGYACTRCPFEHTVWTNGTVDLDVYEDADWISLNEVGRTWKAHEESRMVFERLEKWAKENGLLRDSPE
jgi:hypothetical protein